MAVLRASVQEPLDQAEPLTVDAAYARSHSAALADSEIGAVGLEIETHLVDLDSVADSLAWDKVEPIPGIVGSVAERSAVSLEPGGQLELSGPPAPDILTAVSELRHDAVSARLALAELGLGIAFTRRRSAPAASPGQSASALSRDGTAFRRHRKGSTGRGDDELHRGDAGQPSGRAAATDWSERVARAHRLGPTLVAISASSPWLHGRDTALEVGQAAGLERS